MSLFAGNVMKHGTNLTDEIIATTTLASAQAAANAYLNAAVTSTTPELRAMYSAGLNEVLGGHTALVDLAIRKDWEKPYSSPSQQLSETYNKSRSIIEARV